MPRAKGQKMTAEQRATVSQRTREALAKPEVREKIKSTWTPERRAQRAAQSKAFWSDPANREEHSRRTSEGVRRRKEP